ncbi:MAG: LysE family translocator [Flavobacteriales bacterium]|nr:LysE family translocator [Flavobacteriales bacterium]
MDQAVINGILLGLLISVLIGPVFFLLIEISIREGFRSAIFMDIGIILSDAACIFVAYFGMAALLENPKNKLIFLLVGSGVLIIMGVAKLIPPKEPKEGEGVKEFQMKKTNPFYLAFQGFFYNLLNPSVIIFWITTVGGAVALYGSEKNLIGAQFTATLATVFAIDVAKAWFAKKMRTFISPKIMRRANIVIGAVFVIFGIVLIIRSLTGNI